LKERSKELSFDVIVLGAGAAGLMCAMTAGARGRRVLLLDHADEPGKKILISGGGRCNFTNTGAHADRFITANRPFVRAALSRYKPRDFLALVEKHRIGWHEKTLGQLFCDGPARQIVDMLLAECAAANVDLRLRHRITRVSRAEAFQVETDHGTFQASSVVLATGGLSIPKMGATGLAYDIARQFGLNLTDIRPALVPLTFEGAPLDMMRPLSGVALPVLARCAASSFPEAMLFTHRGLSGPAVLQISSYWTPGQEVTFDLLPGQDAGSLLLDRRRQRPRAALRTVLAEFLPQRLAHAWAPEDGPEMANLSNRVLSETAQRLKSWRLTPSGTEGYAKAEVTRGGIDTACLEPATMQARKIPGLFAIGEGVDVTGWLGGYNFQWAWASGHIAGLAA
jgi:predicted Rossmann fold flavoprotein